MADNDEFDTLEFNALNTSLPPPYSPPPSYLLPIQPAMSQGPSRTPSDRDLDISASYPKRSIRRWLPWSKKEGLVQHDSEEQGSSSKGMTDVPTHHSNRSLLSFSRSNAGSRKQGLSLEALPTSSQTNGPALSLEHPNTALFDVSPPPRMVWTLVRDWYGLVRSPPTKWNHLVVTAVKVVVKDQHNNFLHLKVKNLKEDKDQFLIVIQHDSWRNCGMADNRSEGIYDNLYVLGAEDRDSRFHGRVLQDIRLTGNYASLKLTDTLEILCLTSMSLTKRYTALDPNPYRFPIIAFTTIFRVAPNCKRTAFKSEMSAKEAASVLGIKLIGCEIRGGMIGEAEAGADFNETSGDSFSNGTDCGIGGPSHAISADLEGP